MLLLLPTNAHHTSYHQLTAITAVETNQPPTNNESNTMFVLSHAQPSVGFRRVYLSVRVPQQTTQGKHREAHSAADGTCIQAQTKLTLTSTVYSTEAWMTWVSKSTSMRRDTCVAATSSGLDWEALSSHGAIFFSSLQHTKARKKDRSELDCSWFRKHRGSYQTSDVASAGVGTVRELEGYTCGPNPRS